MIEADGHPCIVFGQIVDSVGNGFAVGLPREVVGGYLDRFTTGMPFFTGLGVPSYQFLFLFVHTAPDRRPRRTRRSMHSANSTPPPRFRLSGHRNTTIALI